MLRKNKNISCQCIKLTDSRPEVLISKQGDLPRIWCWIRRWNTWCSSSLHEPWNASRTSFGWIFVFNAASSLVGRNHIYGPFMFDSTGCGNTFFFFPEARQTPSVVSASNNKHHAVFPRTKRRRWSRRGAFGPSLSGMISDYSWCGSPEEWWGNKSTEVKQIKADAPLSEP